jgi:hypothetical protein
MSWRKIADNIHAYQNKKGHLSLVHNQWMKKGMFSAQKSCSGDEKNSMQKPPQPYGLRRCNRARFKAGLLSLLLWQIEIFSCPFTLLIDDIAYSK